MVAHANGLCRSMGIILVFWGTVAAGQAQEFAGGTGEPNNPYQIATAAQLISIGSDPNLLDKHFILRNDIDLDPNLPGGRVFGRAVIAAYTSETGITPADFTGTFDGRGHTIRNLTLDNAAEDPLGLFGGIGKEGVVKDVGIEAAWIGGTGSGSHGALVGGNEGRLIRCYAKGHVSGSVHVGVLAGGNSGEIIGCSAVGEVVGLWQVGGLVGYNNGGAIIDSHADCAVRTTKTFDSWTGGLVGCNLGVIVNCWATGDVFATRGQDLGGLVGYTNGGIIAHCHATGNVSVQQGQTYDSLGGLVGDLEGGVICSCYATGNVSGGDNSGRMGGLIGQSNYGYIGASYALGRVSGGKGSKCLGGLIGLNYGWSVVQIKACFWDVGASGLSTSDGGTGLTTAQMQDARTFIQAGWDWVGERTHGTADLWFIPEDGGYPQLTVTSSAYQPRKLKGSGTPEDPYRIATAEDLGAINHYDAAAYYRLDADIDLAGIIWGQAPIAYLAGRLDGAGKSVRALRVSGGDLGLLGTLGQNGSVMNLGIRDANLTAEGADISGPLASINQGRVTGCRADGVTANGREGGGLIGQNEGSISDSYACGVVTNPCSLGLGGLTGRNFGTISRCYAAAYVAGTTQRGSGFMNATGGLVGVSSFLGKTGQASDSYFLIDTDGGGPDNGLGLPLTAGQMKQQASFVHWDFANTWTICEGQDYPRLRWEKIACSQP